MSLSTYHQLEREIQKECCMQDIELNNTDEPMAIYDDEEE